MSEKRCPGCVELKSNSEFYKSKGRKDGLQVYCKSCLGDKVKDWNRRNPERVRENQRSWVENNTERVQELQRERYKNNPEKAAERARLYRKRNPERVKELKRQARVRHRDKINEYKRMQGKLHPERLSAIRAVYRAVKKGGLIRPDVCSDCGEPHEKIDGHHEDYSKWLEVEWLCPQCHSDRHSMKREVA